MSEENKDVVTFEYDDGDTYLGEVNENGEPHGRGVLKSKDNFVTTNGWFKNGLLHGEATISKGYNKENEDETLKQNRKGNFEEGLMHGTHTFEAHRDGKMRKIIQEFYKDELIYDTNEYGKHCFYLSNVSDYDYLFAENISLDNVLEITFESEEVIEKIDFINNKLQKLGYVKLIFQNYSNWINHQEKMLSLFKEENFNHKCIPNIIIREIEIKNREDVSKISYFAKNFIKKVYRSFALSRINSFEDNFDEFSISYNNISNDLVLDKFNFGDQSSWGYYELDNMKSLSAEEHEKLCSEGLKNYNIHQWMELDAEYDIFIRVFNND